MDDSGMCYEYYYFFDKDRSVLNMTVASAVPV